MAGKMFKVFDWKQAAKQNSAAMLRFLKSVQNKPLTKR